MKALEGVDTKVMPAGVRTDAFLCFEGGISGRLANFDASTGLGDVYPAAICWRRFVSEALRQPLIGAKLRFTVKKGDVWTCAKADNTEGTQNTSNAVAIMRVIDLMTA